MESYSARKFGISRLATRRSQRQQHLRDLQDRPQPLADAPRRRPRRWARAAACRSSTRSRRRRLRRSRSRSTTSRSAHLRPHDDGHDGHQGADRGVGHGERAALLDLNVRDEQTDPKNSLEIKTRRFTSPPARSASRPRSSNASTGPLDDLLVPLENTLADVNISFGVTALAAHARHDDPGTVRGHRRLGRSAAAWSSPAVHQRQGKKKSAPPTSSKGSPPRLTAGDATPDDVQTRCRSTKGRRTGDFESGVRMAPAVGADEARFLSVSSSAGDGADRQSVATYRLNDQDLASRLFLFLWGTAAGRGADEGGERRLARTTLGLEKQVRRMLADRRADALSRRFARAVAALQDSRRSIPTCCCFLSTTTRWRSR